MAATSTISKKGKRSNLGPLLVNGSLLLLMLIWILPTFALLVSSFRTRFDIQTSGWWSVVPHREWMTVEAIAPDPNWDRDGVMNIEGAQGTFEELRNGITLDDGTRVLWIGNKRIGKVEIQEFKWTTNFDFTLENYGQVLGGEDL